MSHPKEAAVGPASGPLLSCQTPNHHHHHHHLPDLDAEESLAAARAASVQEPAQPPAAVRGSQSDHDPSHVWIPDLISRIADFLPNPNQVPLCLRLVNRAAAAHLRRRRDLTVRLSLPAPHTEFAWRFRGAGGGACHGTPGQAKERESGSVGDGKFSFGVQPHTTSWQLRQLLQLAARSGAVENLRVAAAALRAAFTPPPPPLPQPSVEPVAAAKAVAAVSLDRLDAGAAAAAATGAAAAAGAAETGVVRAMVVGAAAAPSAGEQIVTEAGAAAIAEAAGAGHAAAAVWLVREGGFAASKTALERAARAGDEAMCRWLLGPEGGCPWTFAAPVAALRSGHARLGEWLMRRRPCGAGTSGGTGLGSGLPSCASLTSLSVAPAGAGAGAAAPGAGAESAAKAAAAADDNADGPAPQRPGQVLGGRRTWLDAVMTAAARGCSLEELAGLHERWLDSRGATIEGPGRNLVLAAAAGSPTPDWADKVTWLAGEGYWSGTPAAAEAAAAGGRARLEWLEARGYVVGEDAAEAAARAGQLELLSHLLTERRLRLGPAGAAAALNGAIGAGQLAAAQLLVSAGGCRPQEQQLLRAAAGGDVQMVVWLLNTVGHRLVDKDANSANTDTNTGIVAHAAAPGAGPEPAPAALPAAAGAPATVAIAPGEPISADELLLVAAGSEVTAGSADVLQALWDWSVSDGWSCPGDGHERGAPATRSCPVEAATAVAAEAAPAVAAGSDADGSGVSGGGGIGSALDAGRAALRRAWQNPTLFAAAVAAGSEEKAAWLAAHGCGMPADGGPYVYAAVAGDIPMLRRLQELGCSWGLKPYAPRRGSSGRQADAGSRGSPCACGSQERGMLNSGAASSTSGSGGDSSPTSRAADRAPGASTVFCGSDNAVGGISGVAGSSTIRGSSSSVFLRALYTPEGVPTPLGVRRTADEGPLRWLAAAQQRAAAAVSADAVADCGGCSSCGAGAGGGPGGDAGVDWEAALEVARAWRRGDVWLHAWLETEVAAAMQRRGSRGIRDV